jgi:hypothetical protein
MFGKLGRWSSSSDRKAVVMGSWGNGNFEQDGVLDFVWREVQQPLLRKIQMMVEKPANAEADEPESGSIVAAVEILALLSEHVNAAPPKPVEVANWKQTFLDAWDRTASDVYAEQEDVIERRSVIAGTFDRLIASAVKFHDEGA